MTVSWIIALAVFGVGVYKLYFWVDTYKFEKLYTRGAYTPTVSEITLDDGRAAHAVTYYGNDGDRIFVEEINKTIEISGGTARLEIADSDWFGYDIENQESAQVYIASTLIYESGDKRKLPTVDFEVIAPESPI